MSDSRRLPKNVFLQMLEFYRRQYVIGTGERKELGNLSMPYEIKETKALGLCKPYTKPETPRVLNWYNLTEKGEKVLEEYQRNGLTPDSFDNYELKDHALYHRLSLLKFQL